MARPSTKVRSKISTQHSVYQEFDRRRELFLRIRKMGLQGDKNQGNERSDSNVTALIPASNAGASEAPAPSSTPAAAAVAEKPRSRAWGLVVPMTAIVVAFGAVAGAGANWDSWIASRPVQSTDDAAVYADVSSVSARVSGTIENVSVRDYEKVKAGDLLFSIDHKPYEVALGAAKAKLAAARAQIEDNDGQQTFQRTQIDVAISQRQASRADLVQTSKELERQKRLGLDSRASSLQNLEKSVAAHERALANSNIADATVSAQRVKLDVLGKTRQVLEANVNTALAEVSARELDLSYASVRAPIDGIVSKRNVQLGNFVNAGAALISIVPLPHIYVLANYKEVQLSAVREGQLVDISVDMLPGANFKGKVAKISPAGGATFALLPPDNATGNFTKVAQRLTVRIELDSDQLDFDRLRPGMSVVTNINTKKAGERG
ncbi:HlyD family secretion protein [Rhizobium sp. 16-449-1b]|uniref:HlyD family secretion protein n=1 Tax=Rhizobium sp. 16-449-1b TaxID=2819989 RepID=UPI001FFE07F2|nr:HlyD family secretion protein [Rhizobium sp. 16-449-1b]